MTTDSAKGPPSAEPAQALQYLPNLASVDKEQARSASIKPRPRQGQVTEELPREEPPNEKARTEAAEGQEKGGQSRRDGGRLAASADRAAQDGPSIFPMKDDGKPLEHMDGTVRV